MSDKFKEFLDELPESNNAPYPHPNTGMSFKYRMEQAERRQKIVLKMMKKNPDIGKYTISKLTGIPSSSVCNAMRALQRDGKLKWDPDKAQAGGWRPV